jgi:3'(2'), 5'-bisphosphate nucleotidase
MSELDRIADGFADLASQAGAKILDVYARGCPARAKADASPVTEADEAAEALILPGLAKLLPGVPMVAEESVSGGAKPDCRGGTFLLIDPLDGTREFLSRNGEFTVNIALVADGKPAVGAVYAPATGTLYLGGDSARRATLVAGETFEPASAHQIATRTPTPGALVAVASRSHADADTDAWLRGHAVAKVTTAGSALKFGLVAEGAADVYPRFAPTSEWDVAAGDAVLRAAGGLVLTPDGAPLCYGKAEARFLNGAFIAWGRAPDTTVRAGPGRACSGVS